MNDPLEPTWAEDEINRLKDRVAKLEAGIEVWWRDLNPDLATDADIQLRALHAEEADR